MNPLDRARIGTTDVQVTRLGLGTAPLGGWPDALPRDIAEATVRRAWEAGLRYFDTAPLYGYGLSERYLGRVLADEARDSFAVSTKVGRLLESGRAADPLFQGAPALTPVFDFSSSGIRQSLQGSRDRLDLQRVDVVFIHDPDDHHAEALKDAYPVLASLRRDGDIGAVGVGMMHHEPLQRFAEEGDFDCMLLAGRYTLLEQDALPLLETAVQRRISIIAGGVFNSGLLVDPAPDSTYDYEPAPGPIVERARQLRDVCVSFDVPLRAAAIQFPLAHPAVASVIVGARSPREVDDCLRMMAVEIPSELWTTLKARGLLRDDAPTGDHESEYR